MSIKIRDDPAPPFDELELDELEELELEDELELELEELELEEPEEPPPQDARKAIPPTRHQILTT